MSVSLIPLANLMRDRVEASLEQCLQHGYWPSASQDLPLAHLPAMCRSAVQGQSGHRLGEIWVYSLWLPSTLILYHLPATCYNMGR